ncbi:MAG: hypothetical protein ABR975_06970, partial [Vulcanimicrobiaceae bacterium]
MTRFFVVSTPRTGNVYMRRVLTGVLGIENLALWTPGEVPWRFLPPDVSVGMHWRHSREFENFLRERNFRVVVTARHPLDVLISILHYAPTNEEAYRWLEGECGDERDLVAGTTPVDEAFVRYALSWRFAALLDVSVAWSARADAILRYAEFVAEPHREINGLLRQFGLTAARDIDSQLWEYSPTRTRLQTPGHYWQGSPNHWRRMIVPQLANAIR